MNKTVELALTLCVWLQAFVSCYLALVSFVYFILSIKKGKNCENFFVFLAALICVPVSFLFIFVDFQFPALEYLCKTTPTINKTAMIFSKCLSNIIFAKRYVAINKRSSVFAVRRAYWFSVCIIVVSLAQLAFDQVHFYLFQFSNFFSCYPLEEKNQINLYQVVVVLGIFLITTVLQTIILVEIVKPLFRHLGQVSGSSIGNGNIKRTLKRVVVCTLVFSLSDFGLIFWQMIMMIIIKKPLSIFAILNLIVNAISLISSYSDYRKRLFPFSKYLVAVNTAARPMELVIRHIGVANTGTVEADRLSNEVSVRSRDTQGEIENRGSQSCQNADGCHAI